MQIEEAKKELNNLIFTLEIKHLGGAEAIGTVLNLLEKKDKQINSKNGTINALHASLKERT